MKIVSLASGSAGNCTYIETDGTRLLVDCGMSARATHQALKTQGIASESLNGIVVTHEHADHINGAFLFGKRHGVPIYTNLPTYTAIKATLPITKVTHFTTGSEFSIGNTSIVPFSLPHDAAEPVGFCIETGEGKIAYVTDLGNIASDLAEKIIGARVIYLEFNHDRGMLETGPYPFHLKERIAGEKGHLSNSDAAKLLTATTTPKLEAVFLGHLSRTNNLPRLAKRAAKAVLDGKRPEVQVIVADQFQPREITLRQLPRL